jgi:hypothetical protein
LTKGLVTAEKKFICDRIENFFLVSKI